MLPSSSALTNRTKALSVRAAVTPEGACDFCPSEVVVVEGLVVIRLQLVAHNTTNTTVPVSEVRIAQPPCSVVLPSILETPRLRNDPNSTVILIDHRDTSETGRVAANLDRDRVINPAAGLSAGSGVCPSLDLSRVQVIYAGTDQIDPPLPFADASVSERRGQAVSPTDQRA
jgi:hypothetical protein